MKKRLRLYIFLVILTLGLSLINLVMIISIRNDIQLLYGLYDAVLDSII